MRLWLLIRRLVLVAVALGARLAAPVCAADAAHSAPAALRPLLLTHDMGVAELRSEVGRLRTYLRASVPDPVGQFLAYNRLARDFTKLQRPDSAYPALLQAQRLGRPLAGRYPLELATVCTALGYYHFQQQAFDSAYACFSRAAALFTASGYSVRRLRPVQLADSQQLVVGNELARCYGNVGASSIHRSNLPDATQAFERALRLYQGLGDLPGQAWMFQVLSENANQQRQPDRAIRYARLALRACRAQPFRVKDVSFFAEAVADYARVLEVAGRPDPAQLLALAHEGLNRQAAALAAQPTNRDLLAAAVRLNLVAVDAQLTLGIVRTALPALDQHLTLLYQATTPATRQDLLYYEGRLGQHALLARQATAAARLQHLRTAGAYLDSIQDRAARTMQLLLLAEVANKVQAYDFARALLEQAVATTNRTRTVTRRRLYAHLATAYAGLGQYEAAYAARLQYETLNDSLQTRRQTQALAAMDARYRTQEKEQRIQALTQRNHLQALRAVQQQARTRWLLSGLGTLVVVAVVFAGLYTRLRRSQRALARATQAKDRLYAVIGHDLRGPLAALSGLADMTAYYHRQHDRAALEQLTAEVSSNAQRLNELLDNLLHWAASQSGELRYVPESLTAGSLLTEVAHLYAPTARARQVTLTVTAPADLALWADRNMTRTILRNLLHNALKVAPAGSTIALAATAAPTTGRLTVTDAGPGLTPEQIRLLFSLNAHQSPELRRRPERGTGLGLPLCQQLAHRQHGTFELYSEPDHGTTAVVTLPAPA